MLIGELAGDLGVTPKTLRLYEERGLLPVPARAQNGYRFYGEDAVRQARLVVALRAMGLSLDQIAELVTRRSTKTSSLRRELTGLLSEQIQDLSVEIAVRQGRMDELEARYLALLETPKNAPDECICRALNRDCRCIKVYTEGGSQSAVAPATP